MSLKIPLNDFKGLSPEEQHNLGKAGVKKIAKETGSSTEEVVEIIRQIIKSE